MNEDEVLGVLTGILQSDFSIPPERVTWDATFRGILGMDSIDVVDLIGFLEKRFGIKEGLDAYRELDTVRKLVDFVVARQN